MTLLMISSILDTLSDKIFFFRFCNLLTYNFYVQVFSSFIWNFLFNLTSHCENEGSFETQSVPWFFWGLPFFMTKPSFLDQYHVHFCSYIFFTFPSSVAFCISLKIGQDHFHNFFTEAHVSKVSRKLKIDLLIF